MAKLVHRQTVGGRIALQFQRIDVSPEDNPLGSDFDEASAQLSEGLKTCRSVVQNYRLMLGGEQLGHADHDADPAESAANDL